MDPSDVRHNPAGEFAYEEPGPDELARAEALFLRAFQGDRGEDLRDGFMRLGFSAEEVTVGDSTLLTIAEATNRRSGKGEYVFRSPPTAAVALQAPHRFKDLHTGDLVWMLMREGSFSAAARNTVPRWFARDGRRIDADLAHTGPSFFNAFTRAFGRAFPDGTIVQLHGFSHRKRKTPAGREADVIVSGATRQPDVFVRRQHACLAQISGWRAMLYPDDVSELGGTTNTNAAALRELGVGRFLHVELSLPVRQNLIGSSELRRMLNECLTRSDPRPTVRGDPDNR